MVVSRDLAQYCTTSKQRRRHTNLTTAVFFIIVCLSKPILDVAFCARAGDVVFYKRDPSLSLKGAMDGDQK
jgi:hypothetical protein